MWVSSFLLPLLLLLQSLSGTLGASLPAGTVVGWGTEIVPYVPEGTRYTTVAAGSGFSLALTTDGRLVGWGGVANEAAIPP